MNSLVRMVMKGRRHSSGLRDWLIKTAERRSRANAPAGHYSGPCSSAKDSVASIPVFAARTGSSGGPSNIAAITFSP